MRPGAYSVLEAASSAQLRSSATGRRSFSTRGRSPVRHNAPVGATDAPVRPRCSSARADGIPNPSVAPPGDGMRVSDKAATRVFADTSWKHLPCYPSSVGIILSRWCGEFADDWTIDQHVGSYSLGSGDVCNACCLGASPTVTGHTFWIARITAAKKYSHLASKLPLQRE